jgi:predicted PurR-regulated permease PerM
MANRISTSAMAQILRRGAQAFSGPKRRAPSLFFGPTWKALCMDGCQLKPPRWTLWLLLALSAGLLLWSLASVITPFLIAAVLAYALHPLVVRLKRLGGGRIGNTLAVVLVELLCLLALLGVLLLLVPIITQEIPLIQQQLPSLFERAETGVNAMLAQLGVSVVLDLSALKTQWLQYAQENRGDLLDALFKSLQAGGIALFTLLGYVVLVPVALFYLLADWERVVASVTRLVPLGVRAQFDDFMRDCDAVLGQYLHGQLMVMLVLAAYYALGLSLFGLDLALPIGVFTGLAMFVPYLGFGLGLVLALLAGLLQFMSMKALLMVGLVYGLGQVLESFYLTPRMVGERIGLHPLAVIFALMAFGQLFGFAGVLVALPASAVLLVGMRRMRQRYFESTAYLGRREQADSTQDKG